MSENAVTRIELLRARQSAVERGDRDALRSVLRRQAHPDCVWEPLLAGVEGGPYVGPEGVLAWYDDFLAAFEVWYEASEYRAVGEDVVLGLVTMHLRGRGSDVEMARELGTVFEFDGDKLRRGRAYASHADAIAEAEALRA